MEVSPELLTFTTASWNGPRTVTVTEVDDADTADETVMVFHERSVIDGYYLLSSVNVAVTDDDVAGPGAFTDHPLRPGVTPVKDVHFTELRARIDVLREAAGLVRYPWTDPVLTTGVTPVRLVHLLELRGAVAEVYAAAGRDAVPWTDGAPVAGATAIRAVHLMELRAAVTALE